MDKESNVITLKSLTLITPTRAPSLSTAATALTFYIAYRR